MDRISSTRSPKAPARTWPSVEIDGDRGQLAPDRVFIQSTPIGYVCAGLGDPARLLRFAFERPRPSDATAKNENYETNPIFAAACDRLDKAVAAGGIAKAHRLGLKIPLGAVDDPALRRLAIASALLKSGFDPSQPRDDDGRWTSAGGGTASGNESSNQGEGRSASLTTNLSAPLAAAGSVAVTDMAVSDIAATLGETAAATGTAAVSSAGATLGETAAGAGWSLWSEGALSLLPRIVGLAGPIGLIGGLIFAPANRSGELESSGTLPDHPDISYFRSEGRLQLYRANSDGQRTLVYDGYPGDDDYYRDADGHVVGQSLGLTKGFVLDPSAIPMAIPNRRPRSDDDADAVGVPANDNVQALPRVIVRNQPEVCPDQAGEDIAGRSEDAVRYQEQITGMPRGVVYKLNGVEFDGCEWWAKGDMIEAKGRYEWAMTGPSDWEPWFVAAGRLAKIEDQMERQSIAAGKRLVIWHFAEKPVADYFAKWARENELTNIVVVHTPPAD